MGIKCYNCEQIGHVAKYCYTEYRCVKCDKKHGPNEYKIKKNKIIEIEKISFVLTVKLTGTRLPTWDVLYKNLKEKLKIELKQIKIKV